MTRIICISGKAQAGKDTSASHLKELLEQIGRRVLIIHYADLLKYMCASLFGWDGKKDVEGRRLLQHVGTDIVRQFKPDFWVDYVMDVLYLFPNEWDYVLIPDCRFPNEIDRLKTLEDENCQVIHLRIVRPHYDNGLTEAQKAHPSETALDTTRPDYMILNNSTTDCLREALSTLISYIEGKEVVWNQIKSMSLTTEESQ